MLYVSVVEMTLYSAVFSKYSLMHRLKENHIAFILVA